MQIQGEESDTSAPILGCRFAADGEGEVGNFEAASSCHPFVTRTREAGALLDAALANVGPGRTSEKTNYFRMLVDVFAPVSHSILPHPSIRFYGGALISRCAFIEVCH